jgi:hypothetical protein
MAAKSGQVPAKFINEDGSVNIEGLADSYRALENKMSAPSNDDVPPQAVAAEAPAPEAPAPEVPSTPQTTMEEMLEAPAPSTPDVWAKVEAESKSGSISESTISELRAAGVPDSVINNYTSGVKAQATARTNEAANAVGGVENLQKAMDFARANYAPEQMEAFKAQLNGPLWEATLKGLALQAGVGAPTPNAATSPSTAGPAATPQTEVIAPFNSQVEMTAAIRDPRYKYDTDYQRYVQARIRANAGV